MPRFVPVQLVATDLDGTLLRSDLSIGTWTAEVLDRVRARGIQVVPVTARQPGPMLQVTGAANFDGWAICANGAFAEHLGTGEVAYAETLAPQLQAELAIRLRELAPDVRYAAIRDLGRTFCAETGYRELLADGDHGRPVREIMIIDGPELFSEPCVKFVARDPSTPAAELESMINSLSIKEITVTRSGAPFVEVAAAGVDKGSGLARLCARLGIDQGAVVAFWDAPNDVAMLRWAGHGIAMADADPLAKQAADEVLSAGNDDEAVADWLATHLL